MSYTIDVTKGSELFSPEWLDFGGQVFHFWYFYFWQNIEVWIHYKFSVIVPLEVSGITQPLNLMHDFWDTGRLNLLQKNLAIFVQFISSRFSQLKCLLLLFVSFSAKLNCPFWLFAINYRRRAQTLPQFIKQKTFPPPLLTIVDVKVFK